MTKRSERGGEPPPADEPIRVDSAAGPQGGAWMPVSRLRRRPTRWLSPGRLAYGTLACLEGRKTAGKGLIAATIAAAITSGQEFAYARATRPRNVLWLSVEESAADAVQPRLVAAGGDPDRLLCPCTGPESREVRRLYFPAGVDELGKAIEATGAAMVVIDPIASFTAEGININDDASVRRLLEPLALLARLTGALILIIRHVRKGNQACALDAGLGSVGFGNTCRSVLRVDDDPDNNGSRLWSVVACNDAEPATTMRFRLESTDESVRVVWDGESDLTADDLAGASGDLGERDARADARAFLRDLLEAGPRKAEDLKELAEGACLALGTLRRAKRDLGVISRAVGTHPDRHWMWEKPEGGFRGT